MREQHGPATDLQGIARETVPALQGSMAARQTSPLHAAQDSRRWRLSTPPRCPARSLRLKVRRHYDHSRRIATS